MLSSLEELNVAGPSPNATVAAPWRAQSMTLALGALDDRHARRGGHELRVGEHAAGPARVARVATQREVVGVELDDVGVRVRRDDGHVAALGVVGRGDREHERRAHVAVVVVVGDERVVERVPALHAGGLDELTRAHRCAGARSRPASLLAGFSPCRRQP